MPKITQPRYGSWILYIKGILPGFLFCFLVGSIAMWLDANIFSKGTFILNYVLIAIIIGLVINNILQKNPL